LFVFVVEWFYGGLFETFWNGQTPGKWLLGIRVLTVDGQPINGLQAVMRNILRFVDMMPLVPLPFYYVFEVPPIPFVPTFVVGLIAPMCNNRYQRLGDIVCGTMVVIEERKWLFGVAKLDDPRTPHLAAWIPPNYEISRSLAKAVSAYVERRRFFSTARRREIARHLGEPILKRLGLPSDTSHDLLLCALYYRAFIADHGDDRAAMSLGQSPFAAPQPPQYQRRKGPPPMAPTPLNAQNSSAQTDDENHEPPNPGLNIQAEPVSARLRR